jgi:RNA polymerase sporulation-specific sigma factor
MNILQGEEMIRKVEICGLDTSTLPKISAAECRQLLVDYKKNNNVEAKNKLIISNIRLVLSIVQRFSDYKDSSDDLFQAGCVGLIKAIDNFNIDLNVQFSTYAVPMIIGDIKRFIREGNTIKINRATRDIAYKCMQAREKLTHDMVQPSLCEIAEEINIPIAEVVAALDAVTEPVSLFSSVYSDEEDSLKLFEQISDEKNTEDIVIDNIVIKEAIENLPEKEKEIIKLRYLIGKTQIEISEEINISQAQVSRLEKNALEKLRKYYN